VTFTIAAKQQALSFRQVRVRVHPCSVRVQHLTYAQLARLDVRGMCSVSVYQGCYNALTRALEFEAAACFRELGIRMYHYNPLAGGMLAGKYNGIDDALKDSGRFGSHSPISGVAYSARYWHQQYFDALEGIRSACAAEDTPMVDAALRWVLHHSVLSAEHNDGTFCISPV
jgi:aflatoxin B1 aldehyde reductase